MSYMINPLHPLNMMNPMNPLSPMNPIHFNPPHTSPPPLVGATAETRVPPYQPGDWLTWDVGVPICFAVVIVLIVAITSVVSALDRS